tara:strand:+ start:1042 stop:1230 length:189 start_codon:yes stop_codon:yes gene_type:complete
MKKRLYRNTQDKVVFGICSGLGDYFNIDPVFIRITWLLTLIFYGTGIIAYILGYFLIPTKSV